MHEIIPNEQVLQARIGLSEMDGTKYLAFGSSFILAIDSILFPLDTIKTIIMAERVIFPFT